VQDEIRHRAPAIAASAYSVYTSFMQRFARQGGLIAASHRLVHVGRGPFPAGGCDLRHSASCGFGQYRFTLPAILISRSRASGSSNLPGFRLAGSRGQPAFSDIIAIFYLMVAKPS
jgi:hypothetical protein